MEKDGITGYDVPLWEGIMEASHESDEGAFGHTILHRLAYMRSAKVIMLREMLRKTGLSLEHLSIFDVGFGGGGFLHACPSSASLYGIELDSDCVRSTERSLRKRGFQRVELATSGTPAASRLLAQTYDMVVCSHVLEHLEGPAEFLIRLRSNLKTDGRLFILLPIHERRPSPHHLQEVTPLLATEWIRSAGLEIQYRLDSDYLSYVIQPCFEWRGVIGRFFARAISLFVGMIMNVFGGRRWLATWKWVGKRLGWKPAQIGLVCRRI